MSDYFHWFTLPAVNLLFVATTTALASRCSTPRWRRFWPILAAVLILIGNLIPVGLGIFLLKENLQPKWLFWYGLIETIVYIIGVIMILKYGLSGVSSETQRARSWPRGRLSLAFGLVFFIHMVNLDLMQMKTMVNLTNVRIGATCSIINLLPAQLPVALNARPVYEAAARAFEYDKDIPTWFEDSNKPDFDPTSEGATLFLEEHQEVLSLTRKASTLPGFSLDFEKIDFFEWPIPKYSQYRNLARLLSLDARSKVFSGDPAGALKDLTSIGAMAGHLRSYPMLISFMMANAVDEIRVRTLEYVLAHLPAPAQDLFDIPLKRRASELDTFLKVLRLEALGQLQGFTAIAATTDISATVNSSETVYNNATPLTKMWRIFFLPSELTAAKDILTERLSRPAKTYLEAQANILSVDEARVSGVLGIFTAITSPGYSRYLQGVMRHDALCGLSDLAMAVTAYKAAKGRYPSQAEDLVPEFMNQVPLDPFDGKPLKLKTVDGGMDLFTVKPGPDLLFEGEGAIHFYLEEKPYQEYRIRSAVEEK